MFGGTNYGRFVVLGGGIRRGGGRRVRRGRRGGRRVGRGGRGRRGRRGGKPGVGGGTWWVLKGIVGEGRNGRAEGTVGNSEGEIGHEKKTEGDSGEAGERGADRAMKRGARATM